MCTHFEKSSKSTAKDSEIKKAYLHLLSNAVSENIDANSPAFGRRLVLFYIVSCSLALILKSPTFHVH